VAKGISVQELDSPFQQGQDTAKTAEDDISNDVTLLRLLVSRDLDNLSDELNNRDKQASQADGSEAVGESALGGAAGGVLGKVVWAEVPTTVDARDNGVDGVLQPL
jgi:hypothetical protein